MKEQSSFGVVPRIVHVNIDWRCFSWVFVSRRRIVCLQHSFDGFKRLEGEGLAFEVERQRSLENRMEFLAVLHSSREFCSHIIPARKNTRPL